MKLTIQTARISERETCDKLLYSDMEIVARAELGKIITISAKSIVSLSV